MKKEKNRIKLRLSLSLSHAAAMFGYTDFKFYLKKKCIK